MNTDILNWVAAMWPCDASDIKPGHPAFTIAAQMDHDFLTSDMERMDEIGRPYVPQDDDGH